MTAIECLAEIFLPLPVENSFTYSVPPPLELFPFGRVLVPFRNRKMIGIVGSVHQKKPVVKVKAIESRLDDFPLFSPSYFEWLAWASRYYMASVGTVLASALPPSLLDHRAKKSPHERSAREDPLSGHWEDLKEVTLSPQQEKVYAGIGHLLSTEEFFVSLIHGVTGSGKTEIYIRLIKDVLATGKEVLFLVPEIGLTPQIISRFAKHFKNRMGLYHSGLTENQRLLEWLRAKNPKGVPFGEGEARVVVGTRSALFIPFSRLGLIILDEEQDSSYKQDEGFRYHARDLAILRAKIGGAAVVLGSATPSLESTLNAKKGKFHFFHLPDREGGSRLPAITVIDMGKEARQSSSPLALSRTLVDAVGENLKKNQQTLILFNRRGFARSAFCLACQKSIECSNCSVPLVYHRQAGQLRCHYCDLHLPLPKECPACHEMKLTLIGSGTETVEEEIRTLFPKARVARLDRDNVRKKGSLLALLGDLREHKLDIVIGTQMVAKGHDIPNVTLVGVLAIDSDLGLPDFRASERTFQLLTQVAGRAGRRQDPGHVIVQSFSPQHYSIGLACSHQFNEFFEQEISHRRELSYPPIARMIQFQFSAVKEDLLMKLMNEIRRGTEIWLTGETHLLGPSPAPLSKIRGRYRWHLILKGEKTKELQENAARLRRWMEEKRPSGVKWAIDVDPIDML